MDNKALYILAGYDDETERKLSGLQNKLYESGFSGVQTKDIPMHFTLGSFDIEKEEELKERLKRIAETTDAFDVSFNNVGLFRMPENDVLFLAPAVSREMLFLKDNFSDSKDIYKWTAHTTLLIDKPDVISDALKVVMNEYKHVDGKVNTLYLYEFWPTRHILTVRLK
jgi:2'-5' RNA ligase